MNKLPLSKRVQILAMLCEGVSMRSISRVVDVSINSVAKMLEDAGETCAAFHDATVRNVRVQRVQLDEIWSFTAAKQKNVASMKKPIESAGDTWTWTALDADTKLIVQWFVGGRDGDTADQFIGALKSRLLNETRTQITSDGLRAYVQAIENAFGADADYAQLVKIYGQAPGAEKRYSPAECIGCQTHVVEGNPDPAHISTSYVERSNLSIRMHNRRFTRLTNAFSKKFMNHVHALAIYFVFYNFCRIHKTLRVTPAMAAGVTNKLMDFADIVALMDARAEKPNRPATYKSGLIFQTETLPPDTLE